jgi:hypothetical protein
MMPIAKFRKAFLKKRLIPTYSGNLWGRLGEYFRSANKKRAAKGGSQGKTGRKSEVAQKAEPSEPRRIRVIKVIKHEGCRILNGDQPEACS